MKIKIILFSALALLMLVAFSAPVMAASPNKIEITASNIKTLGYDPATIVVRSTEGGINHVEYMRLWGTLQINVPGEAPISVNWVDILSGNYNTKTLQGPYLWDEVWTMPNGDTFEGTAHITLIGGNIRTYTELNSHIILHGTGVYEGQILSLSMHYVRPATGIYEGYWLMP